MTKVFACCGHTANSRDAEEGELKEEEHEEEDDEGRLCGVVLASGKIVMCKPRVVCLDELEHARGDLFPIWVLVWMPAEAECLQSSPLLREGLLKDCRHLVRHLLLTFADLL